MIYLILSIFSSTAIIVLFKVIDRYKLNTFNAIVINYFVAAALGYILAVKSPDVTEIMQSTWLYMAVIIGVLFIVIFYVIGLTAQKVGLSVTSVAAKMSVIVPILFSIIYYNELLTFYKLTGILLALLAVSFMVIRKKTAKETMEKNIAPHYIVLPLILFIGSGFVDSLIKFSQHEYIRDENTSIFSAVLFSVAAITGVLIRVFKRTNAKTLFEPRTLFVGTLLGLSNFGSIYFVINALNHSDLQSYIVFGLNNVGIVTLSVIIALVIFKEKLTNLNRLGIALSIAAIFMLSTY